MGGVMQFKKFKGIKNYVLKNNEPVCGIIRCNNHREIILHNLQAAKAKERKLRLSKHRKAIAKKYKK